MANTSVRTLNVLCLRANTHIKEHKLSLSFHSLLVWLVVLPLGVAAGLWRRKGAGVVFLILLEGAMDGV